MAAAVSVAYGSRLELPVANDLLWSASAACLRGVADVEYLFRCGMSPGRVIDAHARSGAEVPLPRSFYLAVTSGGLDPSEADGDALNQSATAPEHPLGHYVRDRSRRAPSQP